MQDLNSQQRLLEVARGDKPADLYLKNARLINTVSLEIEEAGIAVFEGRIAGIGDYEAKQVIDLQGGLLAPALLDGHIHIESTLLTPPEFARAVVPLGTGGVFCDPHEIANVLGARGIQFMLDAMPAVLTAVPDAHYLIVGDGDYRPELEAQVAQLAIGERIHFAGQRSDVADLLAASDLFVLPTLTDALPTVLMEAMALHLPLLATAVGGVPEMVENGDNGLLVPPGSADQLAQATIALLQDEAKRREMGENGRLLVEQKFNIQRQAAELALLYRTLL